ncbi:MAG: PorT family protein [Candidatus Latescibacterota bacterium]|nr:MAG: PorT family protein [Candidatus Latescibacterota bacterium]
MRIGTCLGVLILLFGLSLVPGTAFAEGRGSGGVKIGISAAGQYGADTGGFAYVDEEIGEIRVSDMESTTGFMFGVFVQYKINNVISLQPEVFFTRKGTVQQIEIAGISAETRWRLDYVEAPILLRLSLPTKLSVVPSIFGGPALAIAISSRQGIGIHETWEYEINIEEIVQDNDFGVVVGGALNIDVGPALVVVDGRYSFGLVSWYITGDEDIDVEIKHRVGSIMVGVASPF